MAQVQTAAAFDGWRKSSRSNSGGSSDWCVEVAHLTDGRIGVRNSRNPDGPVLAFTNPEMAAFLAGAKDGEFDYLLA